MDGSTDKEVIEYLLSIGAIEFAFVDENGENVYRMLPSAKEIVPDLYEEYIKEFNSSVFSLWTKDALEVVFDDNGEPMVGINDNSINEFFIEKLTNHEKDVLKEIVSIVSRFDDDDTIYP